MNTKDTKKIILHFALVLVSTIIAIWLLNKWMHSYTKHGEEVMVPKIREMRLDKAVAILEEQGFRYLVIDSVYKDNLKKMDIAEQDPAPGSLVKKGRTIYLIINSLGKPKVPMPKLVNVSISLAKVLIKNSGLKLGQIETKKTLMGDGLVLQQFIRGDTIPVGKMVEKGSTVNLLVSIKPTELDSIGVDGSVIDLGEL
jgi:eukaryotic-like serine/threonine-protein kinase